MDMAYAFHRPDKDRMLDEISSYELTEWAAYFEMLKAERKELDGKGGRV